MPAAVEIDVYTMPLSPDTRYAAVALDILSEDERRRAERFSFARDRIRYIVAHGQMRRVLSRIAGTPPEALNFGVLPSGKPIIDSPEHARRWHFNLSHSGELALLAVTDSAPVGIDIEIERPLPDRDAIAERFFSPLEREVYFEQPEPLRTPMFFSIWTRKEAFTKALGIGLAMPLDVFDVITPERSLATLQLRAGAPSLYASSPCDWHIESLDAPAGYTGAIAVSGSGNVMVVHRNVDE